MGRRRSWHARCYTVTRTALLPQSGCASRRSTHDVRKQPGRTWLRVGTTMMKVGAHRRWSAVEKVGSGIGSVDRSDRVDSVGRTTSRSTRRRWTSRTLKGSAVLGTRRQDGGGFQRLETMQPGGSPHGLRTVPQLDWIPGLPGRRRSGGRCVTRLHGRDRDRLRRLPTMPATVTLDSVTSRRVPWSKIWVARSGA